MKLLASVRSSALQRPSIITYTPFHIPLTCHCSSPAQRYSQSSPSSSSSSSSSSSPSCSQSKRHFSTRNSLLNNSPKTSSHPPEPSLSRDVRLLMRRVPHPVAIITTTSADSTSTSTSNPNPTPRGMTVSSFNTVTLHPKPVISFNVHHPSETLLALQSSTRFLVHLLAPGTAAARLARDFARGNENLELGEFEWDCHNDSLPRLRRRRQHSQEEGGEKVEEDFSFVLECQYLPDKTIQVYDHMIVLGTVEKVLSASPRSSTDIDTKTHEEHDFCLTYADTRFWKMGEQVK